MHDFSYYDTTTHNIIFSVEKIFRALFSASTKMASSLHIGRIGTSNKFSKLLSFPSSIQAKRSYESCRWLVIEKCVLLLTKNVITVDFLKVFAFCKYFWPDSFFACIPYYAIWIVALDELFLVQICVLWTQAAQWNRKLYRVYQKSI